MDVHARRAGLRPVFCTLSLTEISGSYALVVRILRIQHIWWRPLLYSTSSPSLFRLAKQYYSSLCYALSSPHQFSILLNFTLFLLAFSSLWHPLNAILYMPMLCFTLFSIYAPFLFLPLSIPHYTIIYSFPPDQRNSLSHPLLCHARPCYAMKHLSRSSGLRA